MLHNVAEDEMVWFTALSSQMILLLMTGYAPVFQVEYVLWAVEAK